MKSYISLAAAGLSALTMTALVGNAAHADILPTVGTPTVTASGTGTFLWTYDVFVTNAQEVVTGDFFTIYDFNGLVGVTSNPAGFTPSVLNVNPIVTTPVGTLNPVDSATSPNVTFTYSGPTILGGPTPLGSFVLESSVGGDPVPKAFIGRGTDIGTGLANGNLTNTVGPGTPSITPVPEPGAYAFGGILTSVLGGLIVRARRSRRKA